MIAAVLLPVSMFWLGWTGNYESINYWSPLIAIGFLGMGVLMAFMSLFNCTWAQDQNFHSMRTDI